MKKKLLLIYLFIISQIAFSQSFNVEQLGKSKWVNVTGGVSASSVYYSGTSARQPFTYFLNGNVNITLAELYSLPFSFSYSNQIFGYNKPTLMNRLSIHPTYKFITAHIGDASMTFSPYTLSGHQFTGVGLDLTPKGKFKLSVMYGRLQKESEYNVEFPSQLPVYKRFGFGFKTSYMLTIGNVDFSFFKAKDQLGSISNNFPFELGVTPKENVSMSISTAIKVLRRVNLNVEYSNSSITEDIRDDTKIRVRGITSLFLNTNATTNNYNAMKIQLNYSVLNGVLGFGYEHIDPNYRTLGGYFFNNDLENYTVNTTQSLFKGKVNISANLGLQRDDLKNQKQSKSKRLVSAFNINYTINDKINIDGSYSNFQSFTNSKNQFEYINKTDNAMVLDTLNYRQVSQNAGFNLNYLIKNTKIIKQTTSLNLSLQDSKNEQQGNVIEGGKSTFYNAAMSYILAYPLKAMSFTAAFNGTYGNTSPSTNLILGPTLSINKGLMNKKLNTSFSSSFNTTYNDGIKQHNIFNFRLNASYVYKEKHNLNMNVNALFGKTKYVHNTDCTVSFNYTYSFDKIKLKERSKKHKDEEEEIDLKLLYNDKLIEGNQEEVLEQLKDLQKQTIILYGNDDKKINKLMDRLQKLNNSQEFKVYANEFLTALSKATQNSKEYHQYLVSAATDLQIQMKAKDEQYENKYTDALGKINSNVMHDKDPNQITNKQEYKVYLKLVEKSKIAFHLLSNHRWMQEKINAILETEFINLSQNSDILALMKEEEGGVSSLIDKKESKDNIKVYLEKRIIQYYHKKALKENKNEDIDIKYAK